MIRVGDLVKLKNIPEVLRAHQQEGITAECVGLVVEWNPASDLDPVAIHPHHNLVTGTGGDGWVLWNGRRDWGIEYEEDLEIVNESRS